MRICDYKFAVYGFFTEHSRVLASQLRDWREFVVGINRITEAENA
jgi:hypothetical protein